MNEIKLLQRICEKNVGHKKKNIQNIYVGVCMYGLIKLIPSMVDDYGLCG